MGCWAREELETSEALDSQQVLGRLQELGPDGNTTLLCRCSCGPSAMEFGLLVQDVCSLCATKYMKTRRTQHALAVGAKI